jgi:ABC-type bacteriocin/lantibiotic exporter with double-glycine peptidase domain
VKISNVYFRYKDSPEDAISDLSLLIPPGAFVAIVGSSGAGKSTLADIILGINNPVSGSVEISGVSPLEAINKWPGAIAYVPQNVGLFEGSVFDNLRIGYQDSEAFIPHADRAIQQSHLDEFLSVSELGARLQIGEAGSKLSGGQKQRLGIARALFTNPKLIVMDEATSALDGITESAITDSIQSLRGNVTLIVIAHRLSIVRNADLVLYMQSGKIVCIGSFEEVRQQIDEFDAQARAMGL